jgi:hypothetical protein
VEKNRKSHFAHHKFKEGEKGFFTDEDPDTSMFSPNDFSLSNILKDLTGYTSIKFFFRKNIYNIKKVKDQFQHLYSIIYMHFYFGF